MATTELGADHVGRITAANSTVIVDFRVAWSGPAGGSGRPSKPAAQFFRFVDSFAGR